jgi:hypothetical protein
MVSNRDDIDFGWATGRDLPAAMVFVLLPDIVGVIAGPISVGDMQWRWTAVVKKADRRER